MQNYLRSRWKRRNQKSKNQKKDGDPAHQSNEENEWEGGDQGLQKETDDVKRV